MKEYAIIGGGIGGCSAAALLNSEGYDVALCEKEPTIGGCASTFKHNGYLYNAGATTLCGYQEGGIVRELFDKVNVAPNLLVSDPSIVIIQEGKTIPRYNNKEDFVRTLQEAHPHSKHDEFWDLVHHIGKLFYSIDGYYYSNASLSKKLFSLMSLSPVLKTFYPYFWGNADRFIDKFYGGITQKYRDFLEAQILIVTQETGKNVNFFTAALALSYTFNETHYAVGGMGKVCETLVSRVNDIRTSCEVVHIEHRKDRFILSTPQGIIESQNIIMGTTHYDSKRYFEDQKIIKYYEKYEKLNNHQSAYVLYLTLKTNKRFHHHYQLIAAENLPHMLSKALFVSFSDTRDCTMAPEGYISVTASIHTDSREWIHLEPSRYRAQKKLLAQLLQKYVCDILCIDSEEIIESFAATPKTFARYLNRTQLGGNAVSFKNFLPFMPSNDTPIKGFYQVGDSSYAAQGWPGVAMGAFNLMRLLS
ncbi:FAD-dependent oxidoreductase [Sulfurovum sp.]|uniref:phytoene desaturase family protein n=1 Tax=Sulfurovum sp. TaxID=1969726 RepID=UPI002867EF46|nr:FAD-dependent oxidoreductase [Sulfurovum sp.]